MILTAVGFSLVCAFVAWCCCAVSSQISRMEEETEALNQITRDYLRLFDPTHVDVLVYAYLLEGQTWRIGAGDVKCTHVWRSSFTHRILATVETPSGTRLHIPARELWAAVVMATGAPSFVGF